MFCPKCGKGEQAPDTHCRGCGEFLTDFSARSYLINKLLGGANPGAQIRLNLFINVLTGLASALLLGFLNGHYDALRNRTGEGPPQVIYYVYVFLGLVLVWQLLGFVINMLLRKRLAEEKKTLPAAAPGNAVNAVASPPAGKSLPSGHLDPVAPDSVTQQTTKILDKLPRK